jgi:hypothetical protein
MKITRDDSQYQFYVELPPTDYLKDIEIQDEYEKTTDLSHRGLSEEQVSQIAIDSLKEARVRKTSNSSKHGDKPARP